MHKQLTFKPESKEYFEQLAPATREIFTKLAEKYSSGKIEYKKLIRDIKNCVDFGSMSIEDAIMLIFMLISEDARKDLKELLDEMDSTRLKKEALRLEEGLLEKEIRELRKRFRKQSKRKRKAESHMKSLEKTVRKYKKLKLDKEQPFMAYTFSSR